jgi:hypothetical protein
MTQGLYDQIGAQRDATPEDLRAAYSRTMARLNRRRKDLLDQGGDTARIDLVRTQVEESWQILSDPARRRRYDALLALSESGGLPRPAQVWEQVAGVLVSPAAAASLELVRAATDLRLPDLAPVPWEESAVAAAPADTQADIPTEAVPGPERVARPMPRTPPPIVVPYPAVATFEEDPPSLEEVPPGPPDYDRGRTAEPAPARGAAVVGIGAGPVRDAGTPGVDAWIAELGWSGALIRRVREARGLTLRDVGDATRISARYLEALEADDREQLPSSTFVKGYLREIARLLELDEATLVHGYLRRLS